MIIGRNAYKKSDLTWVVDIINIINIDATITFIHAFLYEKYSIIPADN